MPRNDSARALALQFKHRLKSNYPSPPKGAASIGINRNSIMNRMRMAVVGVGALGRHHARILSELPSVELVAVAESHAERGRAVAEQCRTRWVADYSEILGEVDAVSIVVPTTAHWAVAGEFLERGIPVLVEKPLASTVQEARRLVELAGRKQTLLQVGHIERFNPAFQVAAKHCGSPKYIRAERVSPFTFRSTDIGVVLDLMIHDIDLILSLVRSPVVRTEAFGISVMGEHEDAVQARLVFQNGCIADLTASRISPTAARTMQVWSANGCVTVDLQSRSVTGYSPSETLQYGTSPVERARQPGADVEQLKRDVFGTFLKAEQPAVPAADALTAELASFVECVTTGKRPHVGGAEGLQAMLVADGVLQSVATHPWDGRADGAIGPHATSSSLHKRAG